MLFPGSLCGNLNRKKIFFNLTSQILPLHLKQQPCVIHFWILWMNFPSHSQGSLGEFPFSSVVYIIETDYSPQGLPQSTKGLQISAISL
jgi:hypothetical protein